MTLGYQGPLHLLAFDHRRSLWEGMFGIKGDPDPGELARISEAKLLILDGLRRALRDGTSRAGAGILIDEASGAQGARAALAEGLMVAMPVERSGRREFGFEYGDDFGRHIEAFDPTFAKALVRYNPEGDVSANRAQLARLQRLSDWLHARGRKLMFELLVPAEAAQLRSVGGDTDRYDRAIRPGLVVGAIRQIQEYGIEPDVWKIEGLDRREDCLRVSEQARAGGRDDVGCVVLGRGADADAVIRWLRTGAGCPGYIGFAVGRTIWWDALRDHLTGGADREAATGRIAERYRAMVDANAGAT